MNNKKIKEENLFFAKELIISMPNPFFLCRMDQKRGKGLRTFSARTVIQ